jgi:hypothetical protein
MDFNTFSLSLRQYEQLCSFNLRLLGSLFTLSVGSGDSEVVCRRFSLEAKADEGLLLGRTTRR